MSTSRRNAGNSEMNQTYQDYTVGWICALEIEYSAAWEMLDEEHDDLTTKFQNDSNVYKLGRIGNHNVVIVCLPKGQYGLVPATTAAINMLNTFEGIRIGLMVGIGGGAPSAAHDVRLGDVVVGTPEGRLGGVVQYNRGKMIQDQEFVPTGHLNASPVVLLTAITRLSVQHTRNGNRITDMVSNMISKRPRLRKIYRRPEDDRLYEESCIHPGKGPCTTSCSQSEPPLIRRSARDIDEDQSVVHFGTIASADTLMKDAKVRNKLAAEHGVLCFETEAAGLMNNFPCLVIRGICDYSDTHKNDVWQGYGAAAAAAYAKQLLESIPAKDMKATRKAKDEMKGLGWFALFLSKKISITDPNPKSGSEECCILKSVYIILKPHLKLKVLYSRRKPEIDASHREANRIHVSKFSSRE